MKSSCIYRGLLAIALLWIHIGYAQLTKAEYFFNTDPGTGNGTPLDLQLTPGSGFDLATFNGQITVPPHLKSGWHQVFIRVLDATKGWSLYEGKPFRVMRDAGLVGNLEYFFDNDPGVGNGLTLTATLNPGGDFDLLNYTGSIPVPVNMAKGWHQLYVRMRDANGGWGIYEAKPFFVVDQGTSLDKLEYFFDTDPGYGNGIPVVFQTQNSNLSTFSGNISTTGLVPGPHTLYVRAKHNNGSWSQYESRNIYILPGNNSIATAEYFFDTDPGVGLGTSMPVTGTPGGGNIVAAISTTGLAEGYHMLYVRTKGAVGGWSLSEGKPVFVKPVIQQAEWFVDTDPGVGNGTALSITPGTPLINYADNITLPGCLSVGAHKLYIRTRSSGGQWSLHDVKDFTINQTPSALELTAFPTVMHPCPGNSFEVRFNTSGAYAAGNIFRVLLSDANGSFATPVEIGSLAASPSGCKLPQSISVVIPSGTANGTGYHIRVVSSNPVQQADSARDITIQPGNTYYRDQDGDGYGNEFETTIACSKPVGYVENADDCNDNDGGVHSGIRYYTDADGDGFGSGTGELICASSPPVGYSANNSDCNDADALVHQEQPFYTDSDNDGFGAGAVVMLCSAVPPPGYSANNTDCNDHDGLVNTPQLYYVDADGDGYGFGGGVLLCSATPPEGYATNNSDCNDNNPMVHQPLPYYVDGDGDGYGTGAIVMLCNHMAPVGFSVNNTDCDDANGLVHSPIRYYVDADGDGFGAGDGEWLCAATAPNGYAANNTDCNDSDPLQKPNQPWFTDADGDGYATGTSVSQCLRPANGKLASELTAISGDCDDSNPLVNAAAQTLTFSGNAGFENSFIAQATGTPYTQFVFEVKYTDASNAPAPYGYPRVMLDYEGNNNYTGTLDRTIVMSPVDVTDNNTADGKIYRGTISQLATGNQWKTQLLVANGSCSTATALASYPLVQILPDLEIFANDIVISASNPAVSSPLTVTATIHNRSDFAAQNFAVRLINQYIPTEDYGDVVVANIPAHSTGTVTWNITTPPDPAWCPLQVVIDATSLIDETNELNNTALRPFTNGNYNVPGAIEVVANASPEVSYPQFGGVVTISGKAIYTGTAVPLVDPSVAGAQVELTLLETGQTVSGTTNSAGFFNMGVNKPLTPGVYHVQGTVTDFTLTGSFATQFTLIVAPCLPDLTARILLSANQLVAGQSVNAQFRITNNGCAPSSPSKMQILQNGGSPTVAGIIDVPALLPGESFTHSVNNVTYSVKGNYGFSLAADAENTVIEQFENNNTEYANISVIVNLPDLAPYDGTRGNYPFCGTLPTNASFVLQNAGGAASGAFTTHIKVYYNGDYRETLVHNVPGIASRSYYSFAIPYLFDAVGNYTFTLELDVPHPDGVIEEENEANNIGSFGIGVYACPPPVANLVLLGESCQRNTSLSPVDPQYPGTMTLTARAHNSGNLTAPGPIQVAFMLSNGTVYTGSYAGSLAPGETREISVEVPTLPSATTSLVTRVDPNNLVVESNDADNETGPENLCWNFKPTVWCQAGPWGQRYVVNQSFQPRMEVIAEGLYYASQVKVRFEVSGPGISGFINLGDATLANPRRVCAPYCHPVASLPSTFVFQESGVYTFRVTVDPDGAYSECNESDNVTLLNITVVDQPDMRILSQYINPSKLNPDVNEPVTLLVSYENLGANNINDRMKLKILVDEIELTTVSNVAGLITGDKATIAIPTPWSSPLVGAHVIRAIIDADNTVTETNEMNNEATRAIIVGALANLRFTQFAPSNPFPAVGEAITLQATVWNDGDEATDGEVEFMYINTMGDSVTIGRVPVSVLAGGTQAIQLPWFVPQVPANIVAKIVNATMLEATYDDNIATGAIGLFTVALSAESACGTGSNGKLTAVVTGGKAPFTYAWSTGANGPQLTATAGIYQVTVTDANGREAHGEGTIGVVSGTVYYADLDKDGFGNPANTLLSCTGAPVGFVSNSLDCNDNNANIHPAANEVCDGIDNNCDGTVDEGFIKVWFRDHDNDGFGDTEVTVNQCGKPVGYVSVGGDCHDDDNTIYPGATEICDGKDNDCDGATDEGVITVWYKDSDNDGYSDGTTLAQCTRPSGYKLSTELTATNGDCNDNDPVLNPTTVWYKDSDNDGYSDGTPQTQCDKPAGYKLVIELTATNGDCDDNNPALNPTTVWFKDTDNDGYSNGTQQTQCDRPAGFKLASELTSTTGDCYDTNAAVNPGATEICNGIDDDCDGQTDEGCNVLTTWYRDSDGDDFGRTTSTRQAVTRPVGFTATPGDCNDNDPTIFPGAPELCDGKDNNCNGTIDEGLPGNIVWYLDRDKDGFGRSSSTRFQCTQPVGYVAIAGDCKDSDPTIFPGAPELCDGKDNNCNGTIDEGLPENIVWYRDRDNDGFGRTTSTKFQCVQPIGYVAIPGDCNDSDPTIFPGATELCDGKDNNCNGTIDEGLSGNIVWYQDRDKDGFGRASATRIQCVQPVGFVAVAGDCNDNDNTIYPGAPELCDGKDNNCNGAKDEGCPIITSTIPKQAENAVKDNIGETVALSFEIWPNPATSFIQVSITELVPGQKAEVTLVKADGKVVSTATLVPYQKGEMVKMDVRTVSAGLYFVRLSQGKMLKVKQVMILR